MSSRTELTVEEPGGGRIDGTTYFAPDQPGTYHVRLTSVADPRVFDRATITVTQRQSQAFVLWDAANDMPSDTVAAGGTLQVVYIAGDPAEVTFSVVEAAGGTLVPDPAKGAAWRYTAPATPGTYTIRMTTLATGASEFRQVTVTGA